MAETSNLHQLLDTYLSELMAAGSSIASYLSEATHSEDYVRSRLDESGLLDLDEVVEFFTWRSFLPSRWLGGPDHYEFFYEDTSPLSIDAAIELRKANVEMIDPDYVNAWPGDATWLPIAVQDWSEFMAVDCGPGEGAGSVWHVFTQTTNVKMFDTLGEAIEAATFCLQAGLWTCEGRYVQCERRLQPLEADIANPPWMGFEGDLTNP